MDLHGQSEEGTDAPLEININAKDIGAEMANLLKCPVCYEVITPPIILCNSGHAICSYCRENMTCCPTCRGVFTEIRNLFAENLLDKCLLLCRYREAGCHARLPGRELGVHHENCDFRPLICPKCEGEIQYNSFLDHLCNVDKMKLRVGTMQRLDYDLDGCFGSQDEDETSWTTWTWNPNWIRAYDKDFFCFLEADKPYWWIWIAVFGTAEECQNFKCSITVANKEAGTELTFVGKIHPIRVSSKDVREGAHRLHFLDADVKHFSKNDHIEVVVRIQQKNTNTSELVHSPCKRQKTDNDETVNNPSNNNNEV